MAIPMSVPAATPRQSIFCSPCVISHLQSHFSRGYRRSVHCLSDRRSVGSRLTPPLCREQRRLAVASRYQRLVSGLLRVR
jgi:hypothetical protein